VKKNSWLYEAVFEAINLFDIVLTIVVLQCFLTLVIILTITNAVDVLACPVSLRLARRKVAGANHLGRNTD
jgi:hypothetical protein